jgi:hypothetical protein
MFDIENSNVAVATVCTAEVDVVRFGTLAVTV